MLGVKSGKFEVFFVVAILKESFLSLWERCLKGREGFRESVYNHFSRCIKTRIFTSMSNKSWTYLPLLLKFLIKRNPE